MTQSAGADPADIHAKLDEAIKMLRSVNAGLPQGSGAQQVPTDDVLKTMYQEVCNHHRSISDFRGKLLALVPIASGAFIGLISVKTTDLTSHGPLLIVAGVVGAVVTFGLYLFEAWQSDTCRHLIHHASFLEKELHMRAGQFRNLRHKTQLRRRYLYSTKAMERREERLRVSRLP